jgi:hypothetical protein
MVGDGFLCIPTSGELDEWVGYSVPAAGSCSTGELSLAAGGVVVAGLSLAGATMTVRVEVLVRPEWPVTT